MRMSQKQILLKQGVPDSAIVEFGNEVSSTSKRHLPAGLRESDWCKEISDLFQKRRRVGYFENTSMKPAFR